MERVGGLQVVAELGARAGSGSSPDRRLLVLTPPERAPEPLGVLKVLPAPLGAADLAAVADELGSLASLGSPHVVTLHEVIAHRGSLYLLVGWCDGGDLASPQTWSRPQRLGLLADAARGLHTLHELGVVHRRLSPTAVGVHQGRGLLSEPDLCALVAPGVTHTASGNLAGLGYLEPEVVWGGAAGRASDIWSMGVVIHEVLTGTGIHPDLDGADTATAFRTVLHGRPTLSPELDPATLDVVGRCLASRRADRYSTAGDLAAALDRLAALGGDPTATQPGATPGAAVPSSVPGPPGDPDEALRLDDRPAPPARRPLVVEGAEAVGADHAGVVVTGVRCARDHLNSPTWPACARCGLTLVAGARTPTQGLRPALGVLTFDDGATVALTGDVVIGREPAVDPLVVAGTARAARVDDEGRTISRAHAVVHLEDWDVVLSDRESANGTFVQEPPHGTWRRLGGDERVTLAPGAMVRLGEREMSLEQPSVL